MRVPRAFRPFSTDASRRTDSSPQQVTRKKVLFVAAGGGFGRDTISLLKHCPRDVDLLLVGPPGIVPRIQRELDGRQFKFLKLRFARRQDRDQTMVGSLPALILGAISALELITKERPDAVVGVGQRATIYFLIAARLFGIQTVFVESIARVNQPSSTARLVARFHLATRLYVQWPQLRKTLPGSLYEGRLL